VGGGPASAVPLELDVLLVLEPPLGPVLPVELELVVLAAELPLEPELPPPLEPVLPPEPGLPPPLEPVLPPEPVLLPPLEPALPLEPAPEQALPAAKVPTVIAARTR
jgi:hypothetical protein